MADQSPYEAQSVSAGQALRQRNSVDVGGFFQILARRVAWIVMSLVLMLVLAGAYITMTPLTYTSTVSILVDPRDRQPLGSDSQALPQTPDPILVDSQLKLMTSEAVLRRVIESERLEADPDYAPRERRPGLLDPIVSLVERGRVPAPPIDQIVDRLTYDIQVKRPDRTYVVDIDFKASNPTKAARLADALAKAFIAEERAANAETIRQQADWVKSHTADLRTKLETSERLVQDYKANNGIVNAAGTLTNEQQLQDANRDLVAARAKAAEAQSRAEQMKKIIASGHAIDGTYDTINSSVIRQLRVQYSDLARRQAAASQKFGTRHPEYLDIQEQLQAVRTQITSEMQRIASALANEVQVARGNEDAAQRRVATLESRSTSTNETLLKLKELEREAEANRVNYEKFLRVSDGIRHDMLDAPYARILAPANVPSKPSSPKVLAAVLIAISGGLSLGVGSAVAVDYMFGGAGRQQAPAPVDPAPQDPRRPAPGFGTFTPPARPNAPSPAPAPASVPPTSLTGRLRQWLTRKPRAVPRAGPQPERRPLVADPGRAPTVATRDTPVAAAPVYAAPAQPAFVTEPYAAYASQAEPEADGIAEDLTSGMQAPALSVWPPVVVPPRRLRPLQPWPELTSSRRMAERCQSDLGAAAPDLVTHPVFAAAARPKPSLHDLFSPIGRPSRPRPGPYDGFAPLMSRKARQTAAAAVATAHFPTLDPSALSPTPHAANAETPPASTRPAATPQSTTSGPVSEGPLDTAAFVSAFVRDASRGTGRRLLLTARQDVRMKTDLTLSIARAAAATGHPVLVIDGDPVGERLTRLAKASGLPAIIRMDGAELSVFGLPDTEGGAVFVLPHRQALIDAEGTEELPFIDCKVTTVVIDGPPLGAGLDDFAGLATDCVLIDDAGLLHRHPVPIAPGADAARLRTAGH